MPSNDSEALLINARLECDDRTALNADACRLQCNSFRLLTPCVVFVRLTKLMLVSLLPSPPLTAGKQVLLLFFGTCGSIRDSVCPWVRPPKWSDVLQAKYFKLQSW